VAGCRIIAIARAGGPFERADLLRGDIPLFTTRPSSRDLYDSGRRAIGDFFDERAMDQVRRRFMRLSEDDLARQIWLVRASLSTVAQPERQARPSKRALPGRLEPATPDRLTAAARAVGDRLENLALRGERDVSWIGLTKIGAERWSLTALGIDFYDGLPGVALFLAYLGALTGERR
jgi:lantibiotic modifying enzyme